MKKLALYLSIISFFAVMVSCSKDEGEDWELYSSYLKALFRSEQITMMGDVAFCEPNDTALIKRFFGNTKNVVAIEGKAGSGRISICVNDTTAKLYSLSIGNAKKTLEVFGELMLGDTTQQDSVSFAKLKTETLIFYYDNKGETYFATEGYVNINYFKEYATGNFAAKMQKAKDDKSYKMSNGSFLIQGRPAARPLPIESEPEPEPTSK